MTDPSRGRSHGGSTQLRWTSGQCSENHTGLHPLLLNSATGRPAKTNTISEVPKGSIDSSRITPSQTLWLNQGSQRLKLLLLCSVIVFWWVVELGFVFLVFETGFCISGDLDSHPPASAFRWLGWLGVNRDTHVMWFIFFSF